MFRGIGVTELLIVLSILLLIFGPTKLPQLGQAIGRTIRGFRGSITGADRDEDQLEDEGESAA